ncbi:hypothetical protein EW146_g3788 [Bondarzewia mesenterica]|uniref:Uncharacterized protein n=1 Tax=Bondarzewia mesenterica TaxID=1095465 RepID=A0A4V3XFB8_9AGAM|nr:hypothetical protein EW146_g3788 [Bondarzewia mesenterica]
MTKIGKCTHGSLIIFVNAPATPSAHALAITLYWCLAVKSTTFWPAVILLQSFSTFCTRSTDLQFPPTKKKRRHRNQHAGKERETKRILTIVPSGLPRCALGTEDKRGRDDGDAPSALMFFGNERKYGDRWFAKYAPGSASASAANPPLAPPIATARWWSCNCLASGTCPIQCLINPARHIPSSKDERVNVHAYRHLCLSALCLDPWS